MLRLPLLCLLLALCALPLHAETANALPANTLSKDTWRLDVTEENDKFGSNDDRHYTQGTKLSFISGPVTAGGFWDKPYEWLGAALPIFENGGVQKRKYNWTVVGQSIFTPTNLKLDTPNPNDRPYAAWLYTGVGLLQETQHQNHDTLENFELLAGVVGPSALGAQTQNDFHQFIGDNISHGWTDQLRDEPGIMLTYERKWRFGKKLGTSSFGADVIPELGATLGNVMTYGEAGAMVRFGQNLDADYGPNRIRPAISGDGWFNVDRMKGPVGWYLFAATQGRVVGQNIFLDGSTFNPSPSVDKRNLVADFTGGVALYWSQNVRLDFSLTERTKEFETQKNDDRFGAINLAVAF